MNGQKEEKFAETPGEQRVEALLRHATMWRPDAPEPTGLAYQALAKQNPLLSPPRRRRLATRSWWSLGTLSVGAALTMLLYAHPMDIPQTDIAPAPSESRPLPIKKVAAKTSEAVAGSRPFVVNPPMKREAKKAAEEKTPRPLLVWAARSAVFTPQLRQAPQMYPRRRFDRWLVRQERRRPKRLWTAAPPPAAPEKTDTLPAQNVPEPSSVAQNYRVLVPVMLTHESEDGSEIIATPVVLEMAYSDQNPPKDTINY